MKPLACAALVVLLMAGNACAPAASPPEPKATVEQDMAAIEKIRSDYTSAWKAGDADRIANLYGDDAIALPGNQPTASGRSAILKFNKDFFDQFTPGSLDLGPQETKIIGDWAFDRGTYTVMATSKAGGQPMNDQGRYLVILQRQADGSWKVARDMDNNDHPPAPPPPESATKKK